MHAHGDEKPPPMRERVETHDTCHVIVKWREARGFVRQSHVDNPVTGVDATMTEEELTGYANIRALKVMTVGKYVNALRWSPASASTTDRCSVRLAREPQRIFD